MGSSSLYWINTKLYPLDGSGPGIIDTVVSKVRAQLAANGCAVLPNFIRPEALPDMAAEVAELAPKAHFTRAQATVYGGVPDTSFPEDHPRRQLLRRANGFVAGDSISPETGLRQIYHSKELKDFLARCLGIEVIYEFGDPLAQLVINVVHPEENHAWHFDSNEFVITVLTQRAEAGGEFEYAPNIRLAGAENYERVQAVIEGRSVEPQLIDLKPGDLQIFFGRYSLHRVRPTRGKRDRHTAILAYAKQPGLVGKPEKTAQIFGRTLATHELPESRCLREDRLVD